MNYKKLKELVKEENLSDTKIIRDLFGHSSIAETDAYLKKFRITINEKLINNFPTP